MAQQAVELILMRQLASSLAVPVSLVDPKGDILFFNEPAEKLVGRRFDEVGRMDYEQWVSIIEARDEAGALLPYEERIVPLVIRECRPVHRRQRMKGADGVARLIEVTAFPLVGQAGLMLGAVVIFWEVADT